MYGPLANGPLAQNVQLNIMNMERAENKLGTKICPYWRRFLISGDVVVALCGKASPKEPRLPEVDIGKRLKKCPWYSAGMAYSTPSILARKMGSDTLPQVIHLASESGAKGIKELEEIWDNELQEYFVDKN
jgi:hypothetical protein